MTMGKAHGYSDAEWQARVELAAAYRLRLRTISG